MKVDRTITSVDEILKCDHPKKATEQCFLAVLFAVLFKAAPTFESVDVILECDHSDKSYWAVLSFEVACFSIHFF